MRRAAGRRDDHFDASRLGRRSVFEHPVGRAMRRDDHRFMRHAELLQKVDGGLEVLEVGAASHDDADPGLDRLLFGGRRCAAWQMEIW
jgi:hypothetical protein